MYTVIPAMKFRVTGVAHRILFFWPVARIFHGKGGGGGGGANLKNRDQKINVGMIGHASAETKDF